MNRTPTQAMHGRFGATRAGALAVLAVLVSSSAYGADYGKPQPLPDYSLRGSDAPVSRAPSFPSWEGFYFGAQAGVGFGNSDFGNASVSQINYILANSDLQSEVASWTTASSAKGSSKSYGGFIGYNIQWGEVITGFELNYSHMSLSADTSGSVGPLQFPQKPQPDGTTTQDAVRVNSSAAVTVRDIMTARMRFGWAYDRFLPYGFVGPAFGRADTMRFTDVILTRATTPAPLPDGLGGFIPQPQGPFVVIPLARSPQTDSKSQIVYGFTAGLGFEVGLTQNLFLRGEWEFVQFPNVSDFRVSVNSVRAGIGLKF